MNQAEELLLGQAARYPELRPMDCVKALYQEEFGCGHLIADPQGALTYLKREWDAALGDSRGDLMERLGENFCRIHVAGAKTAGWRMETLYRLFLWSAREKRGEPEHFKQLLNSVESLAEAGRLPFSGEEARAFLTKYRSNGCPMTHHSECFRQAYAPAYRVVNAGIVPLLKVMSGIERLARCQERVLVAIDGRCASGKTTAAKMLGSIYGAPVFHMDDFFLRPHQRTAERLAQVGGNVDAERFLSEVLMPLRAGEPFRYRAYSCRTRTMEAPVHHKSAYPLAIIEGSYSLHPMLEGAYDLRVMLQIDPETQKARLAQRCSEEMLKRFVEEWIPMEEQYFSATRLENRCDIRTVMDQRQKHE